MKKKLIEVALPLEAINIASAREKSIRHGHPSTLHLWWARRPLAAARAVIFAQMVDDPSAYVDVLRADPKLHRKAETALKARLKLWEEARALAKKAKGSGLPVSEPGPAPTLDDMLADQERQRLFRIIEDLVLWENTTNETVLQAARDEIWQSWRRACAEYADHPRAKELFDRKTLPAFHDPFAGGGALPLARVYRGRRTARPWTCDSTRFCAVFRVAVSPASVYNNIIMAIADAVTRTSAHGRGPRRRGRRGVEADARLLFNNYG